MTRAERLLILRYLRATRRGILSFFSAFAVLGIGLGVAALILVIGVMEGFQQELKRRILGFNPHVVVIPFVGEMTDWEDVLRKIRGFKEVTEASPYILTKVMVRRGKVTDGIVVKGVPEGAVGWEDLKNSVKFGELSLKPGEIVLGIGLATRLGAFAGDTVVLFGAARQTPVGPIMRRKAFVVSGVFDAGIYDYNENLAFVNISELQKLMDMRGPTGVELRIRDPYKAQAFTAKLTRALGPSYQATSWISMNKSLFSALKLEKLAMFIILTLIVLVAAFNIVTTLTLLAVEKTWEIGVLRSVGMTRAGVARVFLGIGLLLGFMGTAGGAAFGVVAGVLADRFKILRLPPDVYFIDRIPIKIDFGDLTWIILGALIISFFGALVPAWRASRLEPAQAIAKGR